jgi:hypothetical protein
MHVGDEEVLYKLLQEIEYGDISENEYSGDSEINVKSSLLVNRVSTVMKTKMSVAAVACSMAYEPSQVLQDHFFHLLESLA